jgi:hypothetical protein
MVGEAFEHHDGTRIAGKVAPREGIDSGQGDEQGPISVIIDEDKR